MNNTMMFYPMAALVLLTAIIAGVMLNRRIGAARQGQVRLSAFRVNRFDESTPLSMLQAGRNYANLLELPVLFYAVCISTMALALTDSVLVALAWLYVALRVVHSIIHVGANDVRMRLVAFALSALVLMIMWGWLVWRALATT